MFANIIKEVPPCLLLGADETKLDTPKNGNVVVPKSVQEAISQGLPDMPHITSMCCHTVTGKGLKNCPDELLELVDSGLLYLASSPSGWQTRDTFLFLGIYSIEKRLLLHSVI